MDIHNIACVILATGYILMFVTPAAKSSVAPAPVYVQQVVIVGAVLGSMTGISAVEPAVRTQRAGEAP